MHIAKPVPSLTLEGIKSNTAEVLAFAGITRSDGFFRMLSDIENILTITALNDIF